MVAVEVGEAYGVDVGGFYAERVQFVHKSAPRLGAESCVEEDIMLQVVKQEDVDS